MPGSRLRVRAPLMKIAICLAFLPLTLGASGCPNVYQEMSDKGSDAALIYKAGREIDLEAYDDALETLSGLTSTGKRSRDGRVAKATAYAGKCGLNLLTFANDFANQISGSTLMKLTLNHFRAATSYEYCKLAEYELLSISARDWKTDDYAFLVFVEMSKIGTLLAGASGADADNDGGLDNAFDPCTDSASHVAEAEVREVGTGLTIMMTALAASGITIGGGMGDTFEELCTDLASIGTDFCSITDPDGFDSDQVNAIRTLIKTKDVGLDVCNGKSFGDATCACI